ncbi:MAG: SHOCT domain-containing protein [Candidatus Aminicenantes bacterium]|nr:SHOCT domain-containing protein [Candidatus Aminicenantes bacterium]
MENNTPSPASRQPGKKSAAVRPSPLTSILGIVVGVVGLIFGIAFVSSTSGDSEAQGPINIFFLIWFGVCIGGIIYSLVNLSSYSKSERRKIPATSMDVVTMITDDPGPENLDFEAKLRKLEALKRDHLISEDEYDRKRSEILEDKW